jgi:hypothetical protein
MVEVDASSVDAYEGSTATNSGTVSDADGDAITMSASVGNVVNNNDGTWSWSYVTVDGPPLPDVQIVTITAEDGNGGVGQVTFTLSVYNVVPTINAVSNDGPILVGGHAVISVDASDPAGDNDPLSYSFDCDNDSIFEIGPQPDSTATCSFDDAGDFNVEVKVDDDDSAFATAFTVVIVLITPQDGIDDLIGDEVEDLVEAGSLNEGQGNAFLGKLENAKKKLDQGKTNAALNLLNAFINQVNSFISEGILSPAEGQALIDAANGIINLI